MFMCRKFYGIFSADLIMGCGAFNTVLHSFEFNLDHFLIKLPTFCETEPTIFHSKKLYFDIFRILLRI